VLLGVAGIIAQADERLAAAAEAALHRDVELVPEEWLGRLPQQRRADFREFLADRLRPPREFVREAEDARP
jgi:hypothetical protein